MENICGTKLNNKGLSLVELIVAVSVGVIISGAIVAMLSFSIKMYRDQNANLSAQYELQTNINQIEDTIMGANCYVIQSVASPSPTETRLTEYAAFGKFDGTNFEGTVFVAGEKKAGRFNIYMDRGTWPGSTAFAAVKTHVDDDIKPAINEEDTKPNPYLAGEGATAFLIEPKRVDPDDRTSDYLNIDTTDNSYVNPLSVYVELVFQKDATGRSIDKQVKDEAMIRNRVSTPIYIGDGTEYKLKEKD